MKKTIATFILLGIVVIYFMYDNNDVANEENLKPEVSNTKSNQTQASINTSGQLTTSSSAQKPLISSLPVRIDLPTNEDESISYQTETLFRFANYDATSKDLIEELERLNLKPTQTTNSSSIGVSKIIRTEKVLKGTRYFHAQFKGDGSGNEIMQHMSFEFKPGNDAFNKGVEILKNKFKLTDQLKINQDDFKAWPLENGYIVWVKKLSKKDLEDNPFNAYTDDDIGTVRVAVEVDIHPPGDEDDHEH